MTEQPHSTSLYRRIQAMTLEESEKRCEELNELYHKVWKERAMISDHILDLQHERTQRRGPTLGTERTETQ